MIVKIILLTGMSGSGKTSIAKNLCERYPDRYNFVHSYTDRGMRDKDEWGHTFIDTNYMDLLLQRADIIAQTQIEEYRYCTLRNQFDEHKVNLYTVDLNGINDTIDAFPESAIMKVLIRRSEVEGDCVRLNRDVNIPMREDVDFLIDNDGTIESSANLLNTFVNFDFFNQPSRHLQTLHEKLDYIDMQYRFLTKTKESLYEQLWYQNLPMYKKLCKYVETMVNVDFDFDIVVKPDTSPEIYDGTLTFNVQGEYENGDLMWDEINRLIEKLSHYSYEFCKENDCDDIIYHLAVSEHCKSVDNYM